ncbi:MAG: methionine biosynthesis protein MetW [Gammaproteobacteria bacterium]|jgi:methionine biosynthesis protein MetW|nr:methionine biosynthesis protein MetW [Gammaproteobacteria bacterium]
MRADLAIIAELINPGARVLDLGCGTGELLAYLQAQRQVNGYGLEIDADNITACLANRVNVLEQNLDEGLYNFQDDSFDMVVMTETLQAVREPEAMLDEMLRIGRECVVTFPNFGHWRCRWHLSWRGRMPIASHLPHAWYDTPNIHLCTFDDFERLCQDKGLRIIERFVVDAKHANRPLLNRFPNFFGTYAFYRLGRPDGARPRLR